MITIVFIERPENAGRMIVDYQLHINNYYYRPKGILRIARFENLFWPEKNYGYYGDIYMKQFIRKWKKKTYENIQRRKELLIAEEILYEKTCIDIYQKIIEYL
jgi:hypothetical protein